MDLHQLPSKCFVYQRPAVIVPPFDFFDVDIALVAASRRIDQENRECEMLANPLTSQLMEYVLMAPKAS